MDGWSFLFVGLIFAGLVMVIFLIGAFFGYCIDSDKGDRPYPFELVNQNNALVKRLEQLTRKYERDLSRYRRIIYEERKRSGRLGKKGAGSAGTPPEQVRGEDEPQTPEGGI